MKSAATIDSMVAMSCLAMAADQRLSLSFNMALTLIFFPRTEGAAVSKKKFRKEKSYETGYITCRHCCSKLRQLRACAG
jgi:hypothetical protein